MTGYVCLDVLISGYVFACPDHSASTCRPRWGKFFSLEKGRLNRPNVMAAVINAMEPTAAPIGQHESLALFRSCPGAVGRRLESSQRRYPHKQGRECVHT